MAQFFAAVDCGTSAVKAAIFSEKGQLKAIVLKSFLPQIQNKCQIEQSPQLLFEKICLALGEAVKEAKLNPASIASLSLSTQRATILAIDKRQRPLTNFISWQDLRGKEAIADLAKKISGKSYYDITGLPANPVFSLAKILWIKQNLKSIYKKTDKFTLLHSYILKKLGCREYVEDYSNASLTGLLDIKKLTWSKRLLKIIKLDESKLSDLVPSGKIVGYLSKKVAKKVGLVEGLPLVSGGGDQQCAGLGAGAVKPGILEITLGTSGVPLVCSNQPVFDPKARIMCCAHVIEGRWELEGFQGCVGSSIQWLDKMTGGKGFSQAAFKKAKESSSQAGNILFYPYLAGAFCPNWNAEAKGAFFGLELSSTRLELLQAVLEGISFETREILELFSGLGIKIKEVRLTGGYSENSFWNQIQADIYQKKLSMLCNQQAALAGAAALAAYGVGIDSKIENTASRFSQIKKTFYPDKNKKRAYNKAYKRYKNIYEVLDKNKFFRNIL